MIAIKYSMHDLICDDVNYSALAKKAMIWIISTFIGLCSGFAAALV